MRLIDADAFLKRNEVYADCEFIHPKYQNTLREIVGDEPTIDAVEVVRCGECRYRITAHGISDGWVLCSKPYTEKGNAMHRADWFCADGEREVQE